MSPTNVGLDKRTWPCHTINRAGKKPLVDSLCSQTTFKQKEIIIMTVIKRKFSRFRDAYFILDQDTLQCQSKVRDQGCECGVTCGLDNENL